MKFDYYSETDSGYLRLSDDPATETYEILDGVNADFNADGALVGIEIERVAPPGKRADAAKHIRIVADAAMAAGFAASRAYLAERGKGKTHEEARRAAAATAIDASIDDASRQLRSERHPH